MSWLNYPSAVRTCLNCTMPVASEFRDAIRCKSCHFVANSHVCEYGDCKVLVIGKFHYCSPHYQELKQAPGYEYCRGKCMRIIKAEKGRTYCDDCYQKTTFACDQKGCTNRLFLNSEYKTCHPCYQDIKASRSSKKTKSVAAETKTKTAPPAVKCLTCKRMIPLDSALECGHCNGCHYLNGLTTDDCPVEEEVEGEVDEGDYPAEAEEEYVEEEGWTRA